MCIAYMHPCKRMYISYMCAHAHTFEHTCTHTHTHRNTHTSIHARTHNVHYTYTTYLLSRSLSSSESSGISNRSIPSGISLPKAIILERISSRLSSSSCLRIPITYSNITMTTHIHKYYS